MVLIVRARVFIILIFPDLVSNFHLLCHLVWHGIPSKNIFAADLRQRSGRDIALKQLGQIGLSWAGRTGF